LSVVVLFAASAAFAQMGRTWPSEKKIVPDPVTGLPLTFLTSADGGYSQSKIYQTHRQWTSDGKWLIFRGVRETGPQAFAVNEETGQIVQVTENGFSGMLCAGNKTMKLYVMSGGGGGRGRGPAGAPGAPEGAARDAGRGAGRGEGAPPAGPPGAQGPGGRGPGGPRQILEIDLAKLFADVAARSVKTAANYQRICGTIPASLPADGNMGLDANDDFMYFRVGGPETAQLSEGQTLQKAMGPRNMGAGPSGLRSMNLKTGEIKFIVNVGFQIGHVQTNPWNRLITGGGPEPNYGTAGTWEHPTGVGIINLRTRQMRIAGQVPLWSGGRSDWHVAGSSDGRWAASDDFKYEVWLYDRHNGETIMLAGPQNVGADHIHPTFNAEGTKIEIQSALISKDGRALNICVVPLPKSLLNRTYSLKLTN
jgi:oligogalacturonide lyase